MEFIISLRAATISAVLISGPDIPGIRPLRSMVSKSGWENANVTLLRVHFPGMPGTVMFSLMEMAAILDSPVKPSMETVRSSIEVSPENAAPAADFVLSSVVRIAGILTSGWPLMNPLRVISHSLSEITFIAIMADS